MRSWGDGGGRGGAEMRNKIWSADRRKGLVSSLGGQRGGGLLSPRGRIYYLPAAHFAKTGILQAGKIPDHLGLEIPCLIRVPR